ncbi:hypothetical protein CFREI_05165 [Corynebacterium freiburgense]|nr:hypothetical protein CFREI_05165 [Corynebacterium freiburgense]
MFILHVLAAILFLGPVTVATSTFQVRALEAHNGNDAARGSATVLHKISNTYGLLSLLVPLLGFGVLFSNMAYLKEGRMHASITITIIAWALLFFLILPKQKKMMAALGLLDKEDMPDQPVEIADWGKAKSQLAMFSGIFAALWVIVAVLMMV